MATFRLGLICLCLAGMSVFFDSMISHCGPGPGRRCTYRLMAEVGNLRRYAAEHDGAYPGTLRSSAVCPLTGFPYGYVTGERPRIFCRGWAHRGTLGRVNAVVGMDERIHWECDPAPTLTEDAIVVKITLIQLLSRSDVRLVLLVVIAALLLGFSLVYGTKDACEE